jgi:hypothetical protein
MSNLKNLFKSEPIKWFLKHSLTIASCVLITGLGIAFLVWSSPGTTTIGENISTGNITVSGDVTVSGDLEAKTGRTATFIIAASDSSTTAKAQADYVCDGTADNVEIQAAINALPSGGGKVQLLEGTYTISVTITLASSSELTGNGWGTVLEVSGISGTNSAVTMGDHTVLSDLKIQGSISPLTANWHNVYAGNHSIIERIWIDQNTGGIETADKSDVHINDCRLTNLRDSYGWTAAIHASGTSENIFIDGVYIANCDRGIEVENGAKNVFAENGYLYNIHSDLGAACFSIDAHNHENYPAVENVVFKNFYLERTDGPTAIMSTGSNESSRPRNITFENITIVNPYTTATVRYANNVIFKNISFKDISTPSVGILFAFQGVRNVTFSNINVNGNIAASNNMGTYPETVNALIENVRLNPDNPSTVEIQAFGTFIKVNNVEILNGAGKLNIDGSQIEVSNIKIDAIGFNSYPIQINTGSSDIKIDNVKVINSNLPSIRAAGTSYNRITILDSHVVVGSELTENYGIDLNNITDLLVRNVKVENHRGLGGIRAGGLTNATIANCHVVGAAVSPGTYGMLLGGTNIHVENNTILQSGYRAIRGVSTLARSIIKNNYVNNDIIIDSGAANNSVINNVLTGGSIIDSGNDNKIYKNEGYVTENSGTATIASGATSIVVTHGLATTPTRVYLTPTNSMGNATKFYAGNLTTTQFTIYVDVDPGATTATFNWRAVIGEGN